MKDKATEQYLTHYAEAEISRLSCWQNKDVYERCLVIPCCEEKPSFIERLLQPETAPNHIRETLIIVVINQVATDNKKSNQTLYDYFIHQGKIIWKNKELLFVLIDGISFLIVDRFSEGQEVSAKQGVGLARKLGADLGAALYQRGQMRRPWCYCTDADAILPRNYFTNKLEQTEVSALVFNFTHIEDQPSQNTVYLATQSYEKAIKYYAEALCWAGSPYGFYTLGSAMAIHFNAYVQARGFPKRAGGEDFYMLNKLAKMGKVHYCDEVLVKIYSRLSERIPFGTGPAVKKIMALSSIDLFCYYNPHIFSLLKLFLSEYRAKDLAFIEQENPILADALRHIDYEKFSAHQKTQNFSPCQLEKHFHSWFDAFRTLKLINFLQEKYFPKRPLQTCLTQFSLNKSVGS